MYAGISIFFVYILESVFCYKSIKEINENPKSDENYSQVLEETEDFCKITYEEYNNKDDLKKAEEILTPGTKIKIEFCCLSQSNKR